MNNNYFFDSYAIIELIKGNINYEFVKESIIITSVMNLAEIYYALLLENKQEIVESVIAKLNIQFLDITPEIAIKSALFRNKNKKLSLSYIDCIGYTLSLNNNLLFLTGDESFKNLKNVEFVKK